MGRRASFPAALWVSASLFCGVAAAADIGGWYAQQQKTSMEAAASPGTTGCPQAVVRANSDPTALNTYQAAHCYLQGDAPDLVAARAWLARSAELNFLPAQRLLRALAIAEAGVHRSQRHCHDLGEGRQLCHGAAPPKEATRTN